MRRSDREITDPSKIEDVIASCTHMHLGFCDSGQVYIVPLNYGYELNNNKYTFYFHSAAEGRKIDLIRSNPLVGFEMDTDLRINTGELACSCSASFRSVIGNGRAFIVDSREEKVRGLECIMLHTTGRSAWSFRDDALDRVCVFKVEADILTCKKHE